MWGEMGNGGLKLYMRWIDFMKRVVGIGCKKKVV